MEGEFHSSYDGAQRRRSFVSALQKTGNPPQQPTSVYFEHACFALCGYLVALRSGLVESHTMFSVLQVGMLLLVVSAFPFTFDKTLLLRSPAAIVLYCFIFVEVILYFCVRLFISTIESVQSISTMQGRRRRRAASLMKNAPSYGEWYNVARALDEVEGNHGYSKKLEKQFDLAHVQCLTTRLQQARAQGKGTKDAQIALESSFSCLKNYALLESRELFSMTHTGEPNKVVSGFMHELTITLDWLTSAATNGNMDEEILDTMRLLKRFQALYGQTALCCSGGAVMGAKQVGVILALIESDCMPSIFSGSSAGAIFSSFFASRTNKEIFFDSSPETIAQEITCLSDTWFDRLLSLIKNGHILDPKELERSCRWFTRGDITFAEAHERSGRVFNVAVTSLTEKARPVLLNYMTAPNVTIASAALASCCCPGLFPPRPLQVKLEDGSVEDLVVANDTSGSSHLYFDGSIKQDIPRSALAQAFNCQFFAVGQTNPHIVPFVFESKSFGSWRPLSAAESFLKSVMRQQVQFLHHMELAPWQVSSVVLQDYGGCATIVPELTLYDYTQLCAEPTVPYYRHLFQRGKVATYPHCARIKLRTLISKKLEDCLAQLGAKTSETPRTKDRRQGSAAWIWAARVWQKWKVSCETDNH